jgi:iron-sulfur cluster assembly protein
MSTAITMTENAVKKVKSILTEKNCPPNGGLRVAVAGGGCSGMSYKMDFAEAPKESDNVIEQEGVRLFIDPKSLVYLQGMTMDYLDTIAQSGFSFENPNAKQSCGCGMSFGV